MARAALAALLLIFVASAAFAALPTTILWTDDFDSYSTGLFRTVATAKWATGPGFNYTIVDLGGGNKVVQTAPDSSADSAWNNASINTDAYQTLMLHFKARSYNSSTTETRTRESVYIFGNGGSGTRLCGYQFNANVYKAKIVANNYNGAMVSYNNGQWHDFECVYDTTSASIKWYVDGVLYDSRAYQISEKSRYIGFYSQTWYDAINWQYDDFVFGSNDPIPEPSSLLALSAFGIGALGFIRRRRT
jgi:hypothetical protein